MLEWIFVTGQPGSGELRDRNAVALTSFSHKTISVLLRGAGKTTAVKKMVDFLQKHGKACQGFYTDEVRENGERIGFDVVTVPDGKRGILARKSPKFKSKFKTGNYFVDVESFEKLAIPSLTISSETDNNSQEIVFVLDEIGRMELHSSAFCDAVEALLNCQGARLVGAVTAPRYGHRVPFCDRVTAQEGVQVHNLTKKTREQVTLDLLDYIQTHWIDEIPEVSSTAEINDQLTKSSTVATNDHMTKS